MVAGHATLGVIFGQNCSLGQTLGRLGGEGSGRQMPLVQRGVHLRFKGLLRGQLRSIRNGVAGAALGLGRASALLGMQ